MAIDVHAHLVPPALAEAASTGVANGRVTSTRTDGRWQFTVGDSAPTRPLHPGLVDVDRRLDWLDANGIRCQVAGPWADLFGYELDPQAGTEWARVMNDALASAVDDHRGLVALATLPLQAPDQAADVLADAMKSGFAGAMIGTQVGDAELDDPRLEPVWESAVDLGAPLFIHPGFCTDVRLQDYGLVNTIGRGHDTTIAASRLLYGGVLERHPGLQILLAHGGGALPFLLGRLRKNHELQPETCDPSVGLSAFHVDTIVFDPAVLRFLCDELGRDRVLCGSDYPFPIGDLAPTKIVEEAQLGESGGAALLEGNATRLFPATAAA